MDSLFSGVGNFGDNLTGWDNSQTAMAQVAIAPVIGYFVLATVATWAIEKGLDFAWDNRTEAADFIVSSGDSFYRGSASSFEAVKRSFTEMQDPLYWQGGSWNGNPI
jgi:hypothetical protein